MSTDRSRRRVTSAATSPGSSRYGAARGSRGQGGDPIVGRLVSAGTEHATVVVAATKKAPEAELRIPYAEIARAQVQVEFARATTEETT